MTEPFALHAQGRGGVLPLRPGTGFATVTRPITYFR